MFAACCCNNAAAGGAGDDLPKVTELGVSRTGENPDALMSLPFAETAAKEGGAQAEEAPKMVMLLRDASQFHITVEGGSDGGLAGVTTSRWPVGLQVTNVPEAKANGRGQDDEQAQLQKFDFILTVGSTEPKAGPEALQRALQRGKGSLLLKVARPAMRRITLPKENRLGLKLGYEAESVCLRVKEVTEGAAMAFNEKLSAATTEEVEELIGAAEGVWMSSPECAQIQPQDFIQRVNGKGGGPEALCQALQEATASLELVVLRLPGY